MLFVATVIRGSEQKVEMAGKSCSCRSRSAAAPAASIMDVAASLLKVWSFALRYPLRSGSVVRSQREALPRKRRLAGRVGPRKRAPEARISAPASQAPRTGARPRRSHRTRRQLQPVGARLMTQRRLGKSLVASGERASSGTTGGGNTDYPPWTVAATVAGTSAGAATDQEL